MPSLMISSSYKFAQEFAEIKKVTLRIQNNDEKHNNDNEKEQAGTVLGQAHLKLELELYFTSFNICCIKLIQLVKLS